MQADARRSLAGRQAMTAEQNHNRNRADVGTLKRSNTMASGLYSAPWTDTGRLQGDIDRLSTDICRKADSYEVSSLRSKVDSLEHTCGELRSDLDEVRRKFDQ